TLRRRLASTKLRRGVLRWQRVRFQIAQFASRSVTMDRAFRKTPLAEFSTVSSRPKRRGWVLDWPFANRLSQRMAALSQPPIILWAGHNSNLLFLRLSID